MTVQIRHVGTRPREVALPGVRPFVVEPGETFDVDDELADLLLAQPSRFVKARPPKKKAKRTSNSAAGKAASGSDRPVGTVPDPDGDDEPSDSEE